MKLLRTILLIATGIITVFFGVIINVLGAVGFFQNEQTEFAQGAYGILAAAPLLGIAYLLTIFKMTFIPAVLDILGSAGYIYTLHYLNSLAEGWMPRWVTDNIASNHYPSIFVSIFILIICVFNYFLPEKIDRRKKLHTARLVEEQRALREDEKIL
ncbi:MAG: hypothetical protein LBL80_00190 [Ruminococcus sp.]|nr:hypothetical protein [Ruminococcus sp.]